MKDSSRTQHSRIYTSKEERRRSIDDGQDVDRDRRKDDRDHEKEVRDHPKKESYRRKDDRSHRTKDRDHQADEQQSDTTDEDE